MIDDFKKALEQTLAKQKELELLMSSFSNSIGKIEDETGTITYFQDILTRAKKGEKIDLEDLKNKLKDATDANGSNNTK